MQNLMELIKNRQSSRIPFDPEKPVSRENIGEILEAGSWAPTAHNMQNYEVVIVDDPILLENIRAIPFPVSPAFIQENYLQLSFTEAELKKKRTGVLATMFPKSWLQPGLIPEHTTANEPEHPGLVRHNQLLTCPALILILYDPTRRAPASDGDFLGIISLGCVLENMWLMATALGISLHIVSALSGPEAAPQIKELLQIPPRWEIAISFRLGYPQASTENLRVRREADKFTHFNGFKQH
ncbi:MAG TPA: nitroreductase family protein [Puia sp.]|jgi:nitroreductase|nr:nitroreductase family protein [Puia sp.]